MNKYDIGTRWTQTATDPVVAAHDPFTITYSFCPTRNSLRPFFEHRSQANLPMSVISSQPLTRGLEAPPNCGNPSSLRLSTVGATFFPITYVEVSDDGAVWPISPGELGVRGDMRFFAHSIDGNSGQNVLGYGKIPSSLISPRYERRSTPR